MGRMLSLGSAFRKVQHCGCSHNVPGKCRSITVSSTHGIATPHEEATCHSPNPVPDSTSSGTTSDIIGLPVMVFESGPKWVAPTSGSGHVSQSVQANERACCSQGQAPPNLKSAVPRLSTLRQFLSPELIPPDFIISVCGTPETVDRDPHDLASNYHSDSLASASIAPSRICEFERPRAVH